jgi:hypothetical protein
MHFEIVGEISEIETIATGPGVRTLKVLRKRYGGRHRRKRKGITTVRLVGGSIRMAEVDWYASHGVGRRSWKIKRFLD